MKKIAFLLNDLCMGGAERCAVVVAQAFARRGHPVSLVLLRRSTQFWGDMPEGIEIIDISADFQHKRFGRWWQALRQIADHHDVMIASNILFPTYVMYCLGRKRRCQTIAWVHGPMAEIHAATPFRLFHQWVGRWIYRQLSQIVFVSAQARDSMSRWLACPVPPGWQVIHNFVPAPLTPVRGKVIHTPLRLLFVGRISPEKSPVLLIETVANLIKKDILVELTLVGDGVSMPSVMTAIKAHALALSIRWVGSQQDIQPYLAAADFLLLTSRFEGCPLVVLEAMQSALPVISTRVGGVPELLGPLSPQLLIKQHDARALSQAIIDALPDYAALSLAVLGRSQAFTAEKIMPAWCALIGACDG